MSNSQTIEAMAKAIVKNYVDNYVGSPIDRFDDIKFEYTDTSSSFDFTKKIVYINRKNQGDINVYVHELFHAISTDERYNKLRYGYKKNEFTKLENGSVLETSFGHALNEGATNFYTKDATRERFGKIDVISSYNFCANIYQNFLKIVGENALMLAYIHGGVNEFVDLVAKSCHTQKKNVINLIQNMDAYHSTYRFFSIYTSEGNSADTKSLLENCYAYLAKILKDYHNFHHKKFNIFENISHDQLSGKEIILFFDTLRKIENIKLEQKQDYTLKQFEKMAQYIFLNEHKDFCGLEQLKDNLKTGEFFNFILLNNFLVDEDYVRQNIKSEDIKSKLKLLIFDTKNKCFNDDKNLPFDIRTIISCRFAARAYAVISDDYMKKCLSDKYFCDYIKSSDIDYYKQISNQSECEK